MRKANIFLHELFTFQFSEATAIVLLAGQGSGQQTGLTSYFFSWTFFFVRTFSLHRMFYKAFLWHSRGDSTLRFLPPSTRLHSRIRALKVIVYFRAQMMIFSFRWSQKDSYLLWAYSRMCSVGLSFHISTQPAEQSSSITLLLSVTRNPTSHWQCSQKLTWHHILD